MVFVYWDECLQDAEVDFCMLPGLISCIEHTKYPSFQKIVY